MFDLSDYKMLQQFVVNCSEYNSIFDNPSQFFHFCYFGKIVFIHKCRKIYNVLASRSCGFHKVQSMTDFDIVFSSTTLTDCVLEFTRLCRSLVVESKTQSINLELFA